MHDLNDAAERLSQSVPQATDDELLAGVLRIVASVSAAGCDGHLGAFVWGTGSYPVDSLPLRLWLFDDGVYIVDALPPYEDLVGSRILSMAGHPMDDVLTTVDPIIPRDNYQTVRLLMPRFLLLPQVHHGLGLVSDPAAPMEMELEARDSTTRASVEPISMADYNAWAGPYGLHLPADPDVLYLSRIGDDLWWQPLEDGTLFVQYNRVERRFLADLEEAVTDPSVTRIVLDIRHNFGGEVPIVEEMVRIFTNPVVDQPGKLFLITGRNTLSAGSLLTARLDQDSSAVIVGETMGGCPTFWGDIEPVSLPYSGIEVSVPTMLEVGVDPDDDRLVIDPELPAPLTVEDWAAGVDPALEAIDAFDQ